MHLVTGDLWDELGKAQVVLVTTNAFVKRSGELVMGRGAAQQARDRFPGLATALGARISKLPTVHRGLARYGVLCGLKRDGSWIGAFQVKWHWSDDADLALIEYSVEALSEAAKDQGRVALNFPGIGNGRLGVAQVLPIIEQLPDNVYVYQREPTWVEV